MNKKFQFGFIAPISALSFIPKEARFHLILAHLLEHKAYVDFYNEKASRGDIIVLDNSAFEFGRPIEAEEILHLIDKSGIQPTYVVAPDYPKQEWSKTLKSAEKFITQINGRFKIMAVPQSVRCDYVGWLSCYSELRKIKEIEMIGMSILGIPNAFCGLTGTDDIITNRVYASLHLINNGYYNKDDVNNQWHHYLGMGNGPRELLLQSAIGIMDSCDSSSPIWHGIQGIQYDESATGLIKGKTKIPVDFELELPDPFSTIVSDIVKFNSMANCIEYNCKYIQRLYGSY